MIIGIQFGTERSVTLENKLNIFLPGKYAKNYW